MKTDIQIPVTVAGITFKNPFYVASGPTTKSVRQLLRIEETGWAAASIKLSIDPAPYINRKPRYSIFKDRNALAFTAEKRLTFDEGLKLIADAKPLLKDLKLMANITYAGDRGVDGWVNMAKRFEEAGADIIELNILISPRPAKAPVLTMFRFKRTSRRSSKAIIVPLMISLQVRRHYRASVHWSARIPVKMLVCVVDSIAPLKSGR